MRIHTGYKFTDHETGIEWVIVNYRRIRGNTTYIAKNKHGNTGSIPRTLLLDLVRSGKTTITS